MQALQRLTPLWRALAALLAFALLQVLFWSMVSFAERQSRPERMAQQPSVAFEMLDADGQALLPQRQFQAHYLGTSGYRADMPPEGDQIRFSILFRADRSQQLALYLSIREALKSVTINGITVQPDVPLQQLQGAVMSEPAYYLLPRSVIQNGYNVIYITKDREGMEASLPEFSIGPADALASAYRWKNRYSVDIPLAGVAILFFVVALCLVVNWPAEDLAKMRWLMLFLGSSAAFTLLMTFMSGLFPSLTLVVGMTFLFQVAIGLSAARYVAYEVDAPPFWHHAANGVAGIGALILFSLYVWSMTSDSRYEEWLPVVVWRSLTLAVILMLPAILALCWAMPRRWRSGGLELMVMALTLQTYVIDRVSSSFDVTLPFHADVPISLYWSPIVGPLLGLAIIFFLARQAGEARETVAHANARLAARLVEQDAALSDSYQQQRHLLERQAMLEERQRIVRDMHDGIGGQLLGLMMRVRTGTMDEKQVEDGLQSSIADLRLIVDSMDTAEDGLAEALRSFEHRIRPQVEAAGLALAFNNAIPADLPPLGPRPTLQVLRILQEAVTNVLRHARASHISIIASADGDGSALICVADDGVGMASDASMGRGLTNMRTRMAQLGGQLIIESTDPGMRVKLVIPG